MTLHTPTWLDAEQPNFAKWPKYGTDNFLLLSFEPRGWASGAKNVTPYTHTS